MEPELEPAQELLELSASGRRIVNLCMFAWLAAGAFRVTETPLAVPFFLGSTVAAIIGTLRITEGLGHSGPKRILMVFASAVPVLGLLTMAWLGSRAAKALRSSGYQVGLFLSSKSRGRSQCL